MVRKRRKFAKEFKAEVVRLVLDGGQAVAEVCRVHSLSESSVHQWVKQAKVDRGQGPSGALTTAEKDELARLRREIRELKREREVARLMRENSLSGLRRRRFKRTTDSKHTMPIAPNILKRGFTAAAPNRVWVSDITPTRREAIDAVGDHIERFYNVRRRHSYVGLISPIEFELAVARVAAA